MEADGSANTETCERTEGAATAVQAMHGDGCTVQRVQDGPKINSTSFGMMAEPLALPCRDGVLVENGTATRSTIGGGGGDVTILFPFWEGKVRN